jgi:hypothetical protein
MWIPSNLSYFNEFNAMEIKVVSKNQNAQRVGLEIANWNVTYFMAQTMIIDLNFTDPKYISSQ